MKKLYCISFAAMLACASQAQTEIANPNSNARAREILKYFQSLEPRTDKRVISGQFSNFGNGANLKIMETIHEKSGHWPGLLGVDYLGNGNLITGNPNRAAIEYWNQGGLVTVSAHLYNPAHTNSNGGLNDKDADLSVVLATNTDTHVRWMAEMDQLAGGMKELKDAGVVVLWRPFHEMNGNWFWWDGKDPELFKRMWREMFEYFTVAKGLDNLLWVYSPNHGNNTVDYYPGDKYVDIIGLDAYTDFIDTEHIRGYAEIAKIKKPFGFTEFGPHSPSNPPGDYDYRRFIDGIQKNFPRTVFFMCWNNKWGMSSNTNVTELLAHPWIVNREDLPKGLAGPQ